MIEIDVKKFRRIPFKHQLEGIKELCKNKAFALFDEMGSGKSKQVIDAACLLFEAGKVDVVVIVTPANVRSVWTNEEMGEIKKHAWVKSEVIEFHADTQVVWSEGHQAAGPTLTWIVTNYEFLTSPLRLDEFLELIGPWTKLLLVLDESSYIKSHTAKRTKAIMKLRAHADRCVILNGTPIANSPLDLWSQITVMDARIFKRFHNYWAFRATFAIMGGWQQKQVVAYQNLPELQKLIKPHCLRRLKKDCLDLPEKIGGIESTDPVVRLVPMGEATWKVYKQLREEALLALPDAELQLETNAATRILRLAQITSGHVSQTAAPGEDQEELFVEPEMVDISSEKLDWAVEHLTRDEAPVATIVWCRWRRERERLKQLLWKVKGGPLVYELYGGQKAPDREAAKAAFSDRKNDDRRVLLAQPHAGGLGLNLIAATEAVYLSNDYSLLVRLQSEDRCHRPGQAERVTYVDVLATGPKGQKTIDHIIFKNLRAKRDLATMTCAAWRRELGAA